MNETIVGQLGCSKRLRDAPPIFEQYIGTTGKHGETSEFQLLTRYPCFRANLHRFGWSEFSYYLDCEERVEGVEHIAHEKLVEKLQNSQSQ